MDIHEHRIKDVKTIVPKRYNDERGFFEQVHHQLDLRKAGIGADFLQTNWSRSSRGVLRGLHYQLKKPQAKLITVVRGRIFDVAVDIRRGSPTFGGWVSDILDEGNGRQIYVPEGFAHGFMVLSESVDLIYQCSDLYSPGDEYGVKWDDPEIGIVWPKLECDPIVSEKDCLNPAWSAIDAEQLPVYDNI